jgi:hypothetical protein
MPLSMPTKVRNRIGPNVPFCLRGLRVLRGEDSLCLCETKQKRGQAPFLMSSAVRRGASPRKGCNATEECRHSDGRDTNRRQRGTQGYHAASVRVSDGRAFTTKSTKDAKNGIRPAAKPGNHCEIEIHRRLVSGFTASTHEHCLVRSVHECYSQCRSTKRARSHCTLFVPLRGLRVLRG